MFLLVIEWWERKIIMTSIYSLVVQIKRNDSIYSNHGRQSHEGKGNGSFLYDTGSERGGYHRRSEALRVRRYGLLKKKSWSQKEEERIAFSYAQRRRIEGVGVDGVNPRGNNSGLYERTRKALFHYVREEKNNAQKAAEYASMKKIHLRSGRAQIEARRTTHQSLKIFSIMDETGVYHPQLAGNWQKQLEACHKSTLTQGEQDLAIVF